MSTRNPDWSYTGERGPKSWATLSESFEMCSEGLRQSPIDITDYETSTGGRIEFSYDSTPLVVHNNGKIIAVWYEPGSSILVDNREFDLTSAHYHSPSEHLINGKRFSAEMHLIHEDTSGDMAIVAVLYELGGTNPMIDGLLKSADMFLAPKEGYPSLNGRDIKPDNGGHYYYVGSTTSPPCTEPVEWFIMTDHAALSEAQVTALQSATRGPNYRGVQPLNERTISRVD